MKAVSAIIAIILVLMIAVSISAIAYMFFSKMFTSVTSSGTKAISQVKTSLVSQMKIESITANSIYVRNIGQSDLSNFSVYINDAPVQFDITPTVIKPGLVGIIKIYDFFKENNDVKITSAQTVSTSKKTPDPCSDPICILCLKFEEGSGTTAKDSSLYGNDGILSGTLFGDFENNLDGFTIGCSGIPNSSYIPGKIGNGLRLWSTGATGLACAYETLDSIKPGNYTIWFYGKGYVSAGIWNGTYISYLEDVTTGCRTPPGNRNVWSSCNANQPYSDWRLFRLITYSSSVIIPSVYIYNNGSVGETYSGYYDFITDGPIWVDGKFGKALYFDGFDDHVTVPDKPILNPSNEITISVWVNRKFNPPDVWAHMVSKYNSTSIGSYTLWVDPSNALGYFIWSGGSSQGFYSYELPSWYLNLNEWTNIIATYNTTSLNLYFNGKNWSKSFVGSMDSSSLPVLIGALNGTTGATYFFNGTIDEVRIYNKAIY